MVVNPIRDTREQLVWTFHGFGSVLGLFLPVCRVSGGGAHNKYNCLPTMEPAAKTGRSVDGKSFASGSLPVGSASSEGAAPGGSGNSSPVASRRHGGLDAERPRMHLPRGVSAIGVPGSGKPVRFGVRLRFSRIQVRVGSRFCSADGANSVAQAFRDVVSFSAVGDASLAEDKLAKYTKVFVECYTKYKNTRDRVSIASIIEQWLKTWIVRSLQKRKRKLMDAAKQQQTSVPHQLPLAANTAFVNVAGDALRTTYNVPVRVCEWCGTVNVALDVDAVPAASKWLTCIVICLDGWCLVRRHTHQLACYSTTHHNSTISWGTQQRKSSALWPACPVATVG